MLVDAEKTIVVFYIYVGSLNVEAAQSFITEQAGKCVFDKSIKTFFMGVREEKNQRIEVFRPGSRRKKIKIEDLEENNSEIIKFCL